MTDKEIDDLAHQLYTEDVLPVLKAGEDPTLHHLMVQRLVQLLDERKATEVKPRVWRGKDVETGDFYLWRIGSAWDGYFGGGYKLGDGCIFVPISEPHPTTPPPPIEELAICTEVDW